jgi:hypothetical protein
LSHHSAAAAWDLRLNRAKPVDVTVRTTAGRHRSDIAVHRSRGLRAADVTTHRRIPITTPARTLLDIAPDLSDRELERALDEAERLRLLDQASLGEADDPIAGGGKVGALVRRVLDQPRSISSTR